MGSLRTGREECGKCTGEVALGGEFIDGYSSNRGHIMVQAMMTWMGLIVTPEQTDALPPALS